MGTGDNFRRGGVNVGRRHGYQIEVEKRGYNPMRNNSLPNRTVTTWNILSPKGIYGWFKAHHASPLWLGNTFCRSKRTRAKPAHPASQSPKG